MTDAIVLGAGVIGLTSAIRLRERGLAVTVVAAGDTVSRLAAAVWYPTHTTADPRVLTWAKRTFDEMSGQAGLGVVMRPTRMIVRGEAGRPWWADAVPDFAESPGQWRFTVPAVEMEVYLRSLRTRFERAGGRFEHARVETLSGLAGRAPIVVNASGLAARTLVPDPFVHPARGQIVGVANPGLVESVRDEGNPAGMTYIHPRSRDVVLGGTFEVDNWDTTVDPATTEAIVSRCAALVPQLAGAPILWQAAGLRPVRHGGPRVERDPDHRNVIHNYGHGGAGVTLAWGCADEVAALTGEP